ncbi:hypothetical protein [Paenibacillus xylanexedens]|uniref:hypothetical protein n=1 Tax=Paenibacillus xylanexedens TaxID=528191 RepID=UPI00119F4AE7|nr:hypothetical protein [Paenibacillus xylanexedens]
MSNEQANKDHSQLMNDAKLEQIKAEAEAEAAANKANEAVVQSERVWFEDDTPIMLRDGKEYRIPPMTFTDTREFMKLLGTLDVATIIMNFAPGRADTEQDLVYVIGMAFQNYPEIAYRDKDRKLIVNRDFIDRYVDLRLARVILDTMMDINELKK